MRLTCFLLRKKMPPGNIWTGKHRMVYKHNEENAARLQKRLAIEEQNMFYLRHSFLTPEQEHGYAKALGRGGNWLQKVIEQKQSRPYRPHVTIEERLEGALITGNKWD